MNTGATRLLIRVILGILFAGPAHAQTGITYRFREDTLVGRVWVLGDDASREIETGEGGTAAGRVEIWKDGGRQIFVLDVAGRTYYELRAFRARQGLPLVSAQTLTAHRPFRVQRVGNIAVDVRLAPGRDIVEGQPCERARLTFSYTLQLTVERTDLSVPGRVDGSLDLCLAEGPDVRLPFGHGLGLTSGHAEVDDAIAKRAAEMGGLPIARLLTVSRRIENGDAVTATSRLLLSDIEGTAIGASRFEIPSGYRFQEPVITPPERR